MTLEEQQNFLNSVKMSLGWIKRRLAAGEESLEVGRRVDPTSK